MYVEGKCAMKCGHAFYYALCLHFKHTMSSVCSHILCAFFTAIQITLLDTKTPLCPQDKYHSSIFFIVSIFVDTIIAVVLSPLISGVGPYVGPGWTFVVRRTWALLLFIKSRLGGKRRNLAIFISS